MLEKNNSKDNSLADLTLNELIERLDNIVAWFESGDVDINEATKKFDQGVELSKVIKGRLLETENKVEQIKLKLEKNLDQ